MAVPVQFFIDQLSLNHRVVVIGGLAVIAHGLSRHTQDADIWLDPLHSAHDWAGVIEQACSVCSGVTVHRLPGWVKISENAIAAAVEETGMVRILGLNAPLDIFRRPNEFDEFAFEGVARRARVNGDRTLLPDPLDLIQSKMETGREKDLHDIQFLESVIRAAYKERLPVVSYDEAVVMLDRFSDWEVLVTALKNPLAEVKELAMAHLKEFAAAGDPFSQAILEGRELP